MEVFSQLLAGLGSALTINHIVTCFAGVLVGTIAGVLQESGRLGLWHSYCLLALVWNLGLALLC